MAESGSPTSPNILDFLASTYGSSLKLAEWLRFDGGHPWHLHMVSLYASILELTGATLALAQSGHTVGLPILVRSMFEAMVDLKNLAKDQRYGYTLDAISLKLRIRYLRRIQSGQNPLLAHLNAMPDLDKRVADSEARMQGMKGKIDTACVDQIKARFDRAGLLHEYESIYSLLCMHTHNDASVLTERHHEKVDATNAIAVFKERRLEDFAERLGIAAALLTEATIVIHGAVESPGRDEAQRLKTEYREFTAALEAKSLGSSNVDRPSGH